MVLVNSQNIRKYREKMGWSKSELGRRAGLSNTIISRIERVGRTRENTIKKLVDALGIDVHDLIIDEEKSISSISSDARPLPPEVQKVYQVTDRDLMRNLKYIDEIVKFLEDHPIYIMLFRGIIMTFKYLMERNRKWESLAVYQMIEGIGEKFVGSQHTRPPEE